MWGKVRVYLLRERGQGQGLELELDGGKMVVIGDFNEQVAGGSNTDVIARGLLQWLDPLEARGIPTHFVPISGKVPGGKESHYDYGLASTSLVLRARSQMTMPRDVSDHDCVAYDLVYESSVETFSMPKARKLERTTLVTDDEFEQAFEEHHDRFAQMCSKRRFDGSKAWELLSLVAEQLLQPVKGNGRARHTTVQPRRRGRVSAAANEVEPVYLVQLRRLRRIHVALVAGVPIGDGTFADTRKRWLNFRRILHNTFPQIYTELQPPWCSGTDRGTQVLDMLIAQAERSTDIEKLRGWRNKLDNDRAAAEWIERMPELPVFDPPRAIHPSAQAEGEKQAWRRIWGERADDDDGCPDLNDNVDDEPLPSTELTGDSGPGTVTGSSLLKRVKINVGTCAGLDDWSSRSLVLLPLAFWSRLAILWNALISNEGRIPDAWVLYRVSLLPRPDGKLRPLSIGSILWRTCASVSLAVIGTWIKKTFPKNFFGSIPQRAIDDASDVLLSCIQSVLGNLDAGMGVVGAKTDLTKAFDNISVDEELTAAAERGLDSRLVGLLRQMYSRRIVYFSAAGLVDPEGVRPKNGVPQGCPL